MSLSFLKSIHKPNFDLKIEYGFNDAPITDCYKQPITDICAAYISMRKRAKTKNNPVEAFEKRVKLERERLEIRGQNYSKQNAN